MKTIVIASGNAGKIAEFRNMMNGYTVLSPKDLNIEFDVDETGETFFENALLKAKALYEICKKPTIADDSGLCVDALNGAPGVFSARYSGGSDSDNIDKLLNMLKGTENRAAHFTCCIVYYDGKNTIESTGKTFGRIATERFGNCGFGYDPIFYSDDLKKTFGEASDAEKNSVSHRARALTGIVEKIMQSEN